MVFCKDADKFHELVFNPCDNEVTEVFPMSEDVLRVKVKECAEIADNNKASAPILGEFHGFLKDSLTFKTFSIRRSSLCDFSRSRQIG